VLRPDDLVRTVWKSADRREERWVLVIAADDRYVYAITCDRYGTVHERARRSRILRTNAGGLRGYRLEQQAPLAAITKQEATEH
jgi:hypothetical protein